MPRRKTLEVVLLKIWKNRLDLQKVFPDPNSSVYHGMTLVDWAKKYGVKEHKVLVKYFKK
jgi:hypothetical protein